MLIDYKDIQVGDLLVLPTNSNLRLVRVEKLGIKSHRCSFQKNMKEIPNPWGGNHAWFKKDYFQPDVSKHNAVFYLKEDRGYTDILLLKRDVNGQQQ